MEGTPSHNNPHRHVRSADRTSELQPPVSAHRVIAVGIRRRHDCFRDDAEQALAADSPVSSLYSQLRGRAAQAQR